MRKVLVVLSVVALLAVGITAFAHGPGWGRGSMPGPGYGHMGQGYGYGYGECGGASACLGTDGTLSKKFLEETSDLRREMHQKRFEYMEAIRNPKTDEKKIAALEKELDELQLKIHEKAPQGFYGRGYGKRGGYGCRW